MKSNMELLKELMEKEAAGELTNKERMKIPQQPMPEQDPDERRSNINEVAQGYTEQQARIEAMRCLDCKNAPCIDGCPVRIDIRSFVKQIANGKFTEALDTIKQTSLLPAVCGRVCPQETQCQETCTLGKVMKDPMKSVSIGRLERYVADRCASDSESPKVAPDTGKKVAIVGSGPGGLVAAADCRRAGHKVAVFEAFHKPGGVLMYGIPEFRLPKELVAKEIETLQQMDVEIICNFIIGKTRSISQLMNEDGYDAMFLAVGAGLPRFMNIPGENLIGVYSANEYLTRANLMNAYKFGSESDTPIIRGGKVAVIGGGNVAMDAARTALRLGAESVKLVYRRTEQEMPARIEEIHHAKEEGVEVNILKSPIEYKGDDEGWVKSMVCQSFELGEPDDSGRRRPVPIEGSEEEFEIDTVIVAIGNKANPLLRRATPELEYNKWGNINIGDNCETNLPGVYAGGDAALGAATVILAMGHGRTAAKEINDYLSNEKI
ncbi:Glutamate synthase [NADPH] small chain [Sedimentisphaera cyanobacteriorum]|uniref:Glutamate synthase [NADPH] small chain n=1 Tax=Sedimentisphaera cyanobacteriorum TaxID=1940790 RepID=A0A1Q2HPX4_9BACT|nr:NADPH-dependent glutamate synthase [Sedimentisphaera cyanobacteriorum]AQQ09519.1 Glutamate synthase [NADPH] small chain [Sedimentisphaera cyanobacteriorum]